MTINFRVTQNLTLSDKESRLARNVTDKYYLINVTISLKLIRKSSHLIESIDDRSYKREIDMLELPETTSAVPEHVVHSVLRHMFVGRSLFTSGGVGEGCKLSTGT